MIVLTAVGNLQLKSSAWESGIVINAVRNLQARLIHLTKNKFKKANNLC
ncbi:MAG: hypothetical protein PWP03_45 [Candidatus Woesearchaeota archaeon]|nr:hypothetical protein [Candidatus Woesearchaeota archaeon]MDN5327407.1 hypothetical protein [Candidatus Woesearchaeota archaeon]